MEYVNTILIKNHSVLMQLRDEKLNISFPGKWALPGGAVNSNEDIRDAVIREFKEETGYCLQNPQFLKTEVYDIFEGHPKLHLFYEIFDFQQQIKCLEGQSMEFKTIKELQNLPSFPGHNTYALEAIEKIISLTSKTPRN